MKLLVGKKVVGDNLIILNYKWHYAKNNDISCLIDHFWDIFKMELIDWYNNNKDNCDNNKIFKKKYETYYKNVMLISENLIIKEIKQMIIKKL